MTSDEPSNRSHGLSKHETTGSRSGVGAALTVLLTTIALLHRVFRRSKVAKRPTATRPADENLANYVQIR